MLKAEFAYPPRLSLRPRFCTRTMRLKLYCNRYTHFKDALVCSVSCVYRARCHDFALFYDEHRSEVDTLVAGYYDARRDAEANAPAKDSQEATAPAAHVPLL